MTSTSPAIFNIALGLTLAYEGGYSNDRNDPGNWSLGEVDKGVFKGTKYGISAASYPHLDIINLTEDQAKIIYYQDFWMPIHGDVIPPLLACLLFDGAVNSGRARAVMWLQDVIGASVDGIFGPKTFVSVQNATNTPTTVLTISRQFQVARLSYISQLAAWKEDEGLAGRIIGIIFDATDALGVTK